MNAPVLVVGLGGSGGRALVRTVRELWRRRPDVPSPEDDVSSACQFVHIDLHDRPEWADLEGLEPALDGRIRYASLWKGAGRPSSHGDFADLFERTAGIDEAAEWRSWAPTLPNVLFELHRRHLTEDRQIVGALAHVARPMLDSVISAAVGRARMATATDSTEGPICVIIGSLSGVTASCLFLPIEEAVRAAWGSQVPRVIRLVLAHDLHSASASLSGGVGLTALAELLTEDVRRTCKSARATNRSPRTFIVSRGEGESDARHDSCRAASRLLIGTMLEPGARDCLAAEWISDSDSSASRSGGVIERAESLLGLDRIHVGLISEVAPGDRGESPEFDGDLRWQVRPSSNPTVLLLPEYRDAVAPGDGVPPPAPLGGERFLDESGPDIADAGTDLTDGPTLRLLAPMSPFRIAQLTGPMIAALSEDRQRSRGAGAKLVIDRRRVRSFRDCIPVSDETLMLLVRGWFVGRLLGLVARGGESYLAVLGATGTSARVVEAPSGSASERMGGLQELPLVLSGLLTALVEVGRDSDDSGLDFHRALVELGISAPQVSPPRAEGTFHGPLRQWIETGQVHGAAVMPAHVLPAPLSDARTRDQRGEAAWRVIELNIATRREAYERALMMSHSERRLQDVGVWWSLHPFATRALEELRTEVES